MEIPGFNYVPYQELLTIEEYGKAYDYMVEMLGSDSLVFRESGQVAWRNHDKHPVTFANVWRRGGGMHYDVI